MKKKIIFFYALVDHNIRKNSANEAKNVKKLLKKHNLILNILVNKTKIKKNIQGAARKKDTKCLKNFQKKKKSAQS